MVLTSVDRDDMADGGSGHFAETISTLKGLDSNVKIEALVSDFQGDTNCIQTVSSVHKRDALMTLALRLLQWTLDQLETHRLSAGCQLRS